MNELEAYCYLVDSLKQDSLEHKGVKGMKWKNHVYKTYEKGKASIKKLIKKIKKAIYKLTHKKKKRKQSKTSTAATPAPSVRKIGNAASKAVRRGANPTNFKRRVLNEYYDAVKDHPKLKRIFADFLAGKISQQEMDKQLLNQVEKYTGKSGNA